MSANFWPSELLEIRIWVRGLKKVLKIEKVCVLVLISKGSVETLKKLCGSVETLSKLCRNFAETLTEHSSDVH